MIHLNLIEKDKINIDCLYNRTDYTYLIFYIQCHVQLM
jgi:hypothetical protein